MSLSSVWANHLRARHHTAQVTWVHAPVRPEHIHHVTLGSLNLPQCAVTAKRILPMDAQPSWRCVAVHLAARMVSGTAPLGRWWAQEVHSLAAVQLLLSIELSSPAVPGHTAIQPLVDGGPTHTWLQHLPLAPRSPRGGLTQSGQCTIGQDGGTASALWYGSITRH